MLFRKGILFFTLIATYGAGMFLVLGSQEMDPANEFSLEPIGESFAVVELFTSEGCYSCPPADRLVSQIIDKANESGQRIFPLSFHVDYWDYLGWKDAYSSAAFSERQRRYAFTWRSNRVYTPQMVINGEHEFVGSNAAKAQQYITEALEGDAQLKIDLAPILDQKNNSIQVDAILSDMKNDLVLNFAIVERDLVREIARGENGGKTLHHDNVVRSFVTTKARDYKVGTELRYPKDVKLDNASLIVYAQDSKSMKVYGAAAYDFVPKSLSQASGE